MVQQNVDLCVLANPISPRYFDEIHHNMELCVESYREEREGVKLEDMVLVTKNGYEKLTCYPFETDLLQ
jgi:Xaa-Pro aminopeptidase